MRALPPWNRPATGLLLTRLVPPYETRNAAMPRAYTRCHVWSGGRLVPGDSGRPTLLGIA
jgi:hypothetical protein